MRSIAYLVAATLIESRDHGIELFDGDRHLVAQSSGAPLEANWVCLGDGQRETEERKPGTVVTGERDSWCRFVCREGGGLWVEVVFRLSKAKEGWLQA